MELLGNQVLMKKIKEESNEDYDQTDSGLWVPTQNQETAQHAMVMAEVLEAGPGLVSQHGELIPNSVKKGQTVLINDYAGNPFVFGKYTARNEIILGRENDVIAILEAEEVEAEEKAKEESQRRKGSQSK